MNIILQFINDFIENSSSFFDKEEFVSLLTSHELRVKVMVERAVTDFHDTLDRTTEFVKFDLTGVHYVTRSDMRSLRRMCLGSRILLN